MKYHYRNTENGRIIETSSPISGGPWVEVLEVNSAETVQPVSEPPKASSSSQKKSTTKKKSTSKKKTTTKKGGKK